MTIDIDICSAHRLDNGEDRLCRINVNGSGTVFTELDIYFGSTTTGQIAGVDISKSKTETAYGFRRVLTVTCRDQIDEEWTNGSQ